VAQTLTGSPRRGRGSGPVRGRRRLPSHPTTATETSPCGGRPTLAGRPGGTPDRRCIWAGAAVLPAIVGSPTGGRRPVGRDPLVGSDARRKSARRDRTSGIRSDVHGAGRGASSGMRRTSHPAPSR
jgi:hypothetical protein